MAENENENKIEETKIENEIENKTEEIENKTEEIDAEEFEEGEPMGFWYLVSETVKGFFHI